MSTNRDYHHIIRSLKVKAKSEAVTPEERKIIEAKVKELEDKHGTVNDSYYPFTINVPNPGPFRKRDTRSWVADSPEYKMWYNIVYGKAPDNDIISEEYQYDKEDYDEQDY